SDPQRWSRIEASLKFIARVDSLRMLTAGETAPPAAIGVLDQANLMIPLAGLIDATAEVARLEKQIDKLRQELARTEAKLGNDKFVSSAPADVVEGVRAKAAEVHASITELEQQIGRMRKLI
ncbi:MAG TPA: valine--tRNA ligase, partial [Gammaproteobacteria bacterium]